MKYLFFIALLLTTPAHAEITFGTQEAQKPQAMMVAGDSVIDDEEKTIDSSSELVEEVRDDAHDLMKAEKTAPPIQDIDPFQPAPEPQTPQNVKRVLKRVPAAKVERSIADERIDDAYVQQMIRKNLDFTDPIE